MKKLLLLCLAITVIFMMMSCGGVKRLSQEEYAELSPQERVAHMEKYVAENPEDIEAKKELYKEYLNMGMPERAIPVMKEITTQDPYQPEVQYEYGKLMMERGENQLAYHAFRDALQAAGGSAYAEPISRYLGGKYVIQQITSSPADEAFPSFSNDGDKIIFQTNQKGNWDIMELELSSGNTQYLVDSSADEELPCQSPDGSKLVYTSNVDDQRPIDRKFKVREVYLENLESGFTDNLTETVADDWLPRFSHDGEQILFVTERSDLRSVPYTEKQSDIYVMEKDGDFHTQLTDNEFNDGGACFGINDQKIYFHSNRNGSYDIFVMNADGNLPMTVLGNPDSDEVNPYASPDSTHLVYFGNQGGNYDIYRTTIEGGNVERLTFNPARDSNPVYSPNGNSIVFHSNRNGNFDIFMLSFEVTSEPTVQELITRLEDLLQ